MSGRSGALEVAFAIPGDLATISGGYGYDRRVIAAARQAGLQLWPVRLADGFPRPSSAELTQTAALLAATPGPLLIDGLAYGAFPEALAQAVGPRTVALCHHPLCLETGLSSEDVAAFEASERAALAQCRGVIVTSQATMDSVVSRFGVSPERVAVAEPGVDPAPRAALAGDPPVLLAVGALIPRKGYDLLVTALARLTDLDWRLEIVGPRGRDPAHERALVDAIGAAELSDRIALSGAVGAPELAAAMNRADLFVAPSRFEGYGMAVAEALARGLPVVAGGGGALGETAAAGVVVDPEDATAFAAALRPLIASPAARQAAGARSWAAGQALPGWDQTADRVASALKRFLA